VYEIVREQSDDRLTEATVGCQGIVIDEAEFHQRAARLKVPPPPNDGGQMRLKTEFFKSGDAMSIRTNAATEADFLASVAEGLTSLIEGGKFAGDWDFQLRYWLPQIVDITCKLRGYKADVDEQRVLIAGARMIHESDRVVVAEPVAVNG
jgi:hypothetical protein